MEYAEEMSIKIINAWETKSFSWLHEVSEEIEVEVFEALSPKAKEIMTKIIQAVI